MRMLIVMTTLGMGGAEKSLLSMLNSISRDFIIQNNIQIDLLVTEDSSKLLEDVPKWVNVIKPPKIFSYYSLSMNKAFRKSKIKIDVIILKALWNIRAKIYKGRLTQNECYWEANRNTIPKMSNKNQYDLCIAYMNGTPTYYAIDKVTAKNKVIWVHNEYDKLDCTDLFQKRYLEAANNIITISNSCVKSLENHFPQISNKIKMIENISNRSIIEKRANDFFPVEYKNINVPIILSIGRLNIQKGFDIGIETCSKLKKYGVKFKWFIIGVGEEFERLNSMVKRYDLIEEIRFIGLRENPYPFIKNCDIFFQPSRFEGKSITLDEAMILSKPIVVSNYDTIVDSITHELTGLICDINSEEFAKHIKRLIEEKELRNKLSQNLENENYGNECEIDKYYNLFLKFL